MKILFDISTLGTAYARPLQGRTGVFRATESIFRALHRLEGSSLTLCARGRTPDAVAWSMSDIDARRLPIHAPALQKLAARHPWLRWPAALERTLRPSSLSCDSEAYLVPHFHHLPSVSRESRSARILILHDVLPLTHPEWFPTTEPKTLRQAVRRLEADDWTVVFDTQEALNEASKVVRLPLDRSHVVPLGIDHGQFRPSTDSDAMRRFRARIGLDGQWFCTLGTLEPRKNLDVAIQAFRMFLERTGRDDMHLVLAGTKGWKTEAIASALSDAGKAWDRIILPGFLSDEELPLLYGGAAAFLFPSLAEGFGLPPLEAMASGAPVVSSDASCMPEVLGSAALWVDPRDVAGWSEAMERIASDATLRQDLRARGIAHASRYTWKATAERLLGVLQSDLALRLRTPGSP